MDLFSDLQVVLQMGKTDFVKFHFFLILEWYNRIQFDLHIYLWINVAVMNRNTKIVVLNCCTIDCINRILQSSSNLLHQWKKFRCRLKRNGFCDLQKKMKFIYV
jgi:hypothetical protein